MSRILVTGGTGSLGSALARVLIDDGHEVTVLVPPGAGLGGLHRHEGRFHVVRGDVCDPDAVRAALRGCTDVYHLAGVAPLLNRLHREMRRVNVDGARTVAEEAAAAGVRRLVHTSSVSAIGYPPDGQVADETFPLTRTVTTNSYLRTKAGGEHAVLSIGRRTGLPVVVVNPAAVIAPYSHRRHGWAALVERALHGRLRVCPPGGLALCAADELVAGHRAAMDRGRPGERYILATANLSYRDLFGLVCRTVGRPAPRLVAPAWAVRAAGRAGAVAGALRRDPLRTPVLVPESAALGVRRLRYDPGKARRELGLAAGDLAASVRDVARWLRNTEEHADARG